MFTLDYLQSPTGRLETRQHHHICFGGGCLVLVERCNGCWFWRSLFYDRQSYLQVQIHQSSCEFRVGIGVVEAVEDRLLPEFEYSGTFKPDTGFQ